MISRNDKEKRLSQSSQCGLFPYRFGTASSGVNRAISVRSRSINAWKNKKGEEEKKSWKNDGLVMLTRAYFIQDRIHCSKIA